MDIAKVVNYEKLFTLDILHPTTDKPIGLRMQVRSPASEVCKDVYRKHADASIEARLKGKTPKVKQAEVEELERTAATIAGWEWYDPTEEVETIDPETGEKRTVVKTTPGADFNGQKPEHSMKAAIEMVKVPWLYGQVKEAADRLGNFTEG